MPPELVEEDPYSSLYKGSTKNRQQYSRGHLYSPSAPSILLSSSYIQIRHDNKVTCPTKHFIYPPELDSVFTRNPQRQAHRGLKDPLLTNESPPTGL